VVKKEIMINDKVEFAIVLASFRLRGEEKMQNFSTFQLLSFYFSRHVVIPKEKGCVWYVFYLPYTILFLFVRYGLIILSGVASISVSTTSIMEAAHLDLISSKRLRRRFSYASLISLGFKIS
jgi:hypothetical protein